MLIFKITKIIKEQSTNKLEYNEKIFDEIAETESIIKKISLKNDWLAKIISYFYNEAPYTNLLQTYFGIKECCWMEYYKEKEYKLKYFNNNEYNNVKKKFNNILSTTVYYPLIKEKDLYTKEIIRIEYLIKAMSDCFENLEEGGILLLNFFNFKFKQTWQIMYLGLQLFDSFIILGLEIVTYNNFKPKITKEQFDKIALDIINNKSVDITYYELDKINKHFEDCYQKVKGIKNALLKNDMDEYVNIFAEEAYNFIFEIADYDQLMTIQKDLILLFKRSPIKDLPRINSNVNKDEGIFLEKLILDNNFKDVIEVGLAFGISAFYMCHSLSKTKGHLISIDPFQKQEWHNYGIELIKKNNFDKIHRFIEKKSYIALPELLIEAEKNNKLYDMIFIDGWHTFDYTLVDFFYADKLIKIGGYIIIDDIRHNSVVQVIDYLTKNFKHYKRISSPSSVACLKKIDDDKRDWNTHFRF
jgi:predicted O-methyltransferase YrrM